MSLKSNIIVGYATQIYVTLIGILILPMYLKYMGAEAYGLVGFFAMLQVWFNLLDVGLAPTVGRETARFRGGAITAIQYLRLIRLLKILFFVIALIGGLALLLLSNQISENWLKVESIPLAEVSLSVQLMIACVCLRWMSGFYRSCIAGTEELTWVALINAVVATLRFVGALAVMVWIDSSPKTFFCYQLLVALLELLILGVKSQIFISGISYAGEIGWSYENLLFPVRNTLSFSLTIFATSSIWIAVTQSDKLILSKMLALSDYGIFTLAVLAANGILMITGPISSVLIPRMVRLQAENNNERLIAIYRGATQLVAVIGTPACLVLAIFPNMVIFCWTGDLKVSEDAAPILRLYSIGNAFLMLSAFPYYLQFSKGDLKLHLIGNILFLSLMIPLLIVAVKSYEKIGAGYVWMVLNAIYFFVWTAVVHGRFDKTLHKKWLLKDLLPIVFVGMAISFLFWLLVPPITSRFDAGVVLFALASTASLFCALTSDRIRNNIFQYLTRIKAIRFSV